MKKQRILIGFAPDQLSALRVLSKETGAAISELVRRSVDVYLFNNRGVSPGILSYVKTSDVKDMLPDACSFPEDPV